MGVLHISRFFLTYIIGETTEKEVWDGKAKGTTTKWADQQIEYEVPLKRTPEGLFYRKLRSFIDAIRTGGKAPVPSSEILYNQAIIDGLVRSAELGHEVEIDIPEI